MSEELSRSIAVISAVLSIGGLALSIRFSRRPSRVRFPLEAGILCISLSVIPGVAAITGVHTHPGIALAAVAAGMIAGFVQGSRLELEQRGDRLYARRSIIALAAWGAGVVVVQSAGAADRAGIVEGGQAVSYFGMAMSFGLLVGRQGSINRLALAPAMLLVGAAGVATFALAVLSTVPAAAQTPTSAPEPKVVTAVGNLDAQILLDSLGGSFLGEPGASTVNLEFSDAGGPVTGSGEIAIDNFYVGFIIGFAEALGEAIGEGITGGDSSSGDSTELRPELANCRGTFSTTFTMTGSYDAATGRLTGSLTPTSTIGDLRDCPPSAGDLTAPQAGDPANWDASFDGTTVTGQLGAIQPGTPDIPFTASVRDEEQEPAAPAGPAGDETPGAGGEGSGGDPLIAPPVDIDTIKEIEPGEAAGAGLVGLAGVLVVAGSVAATAQTAATAAGAAGETPEPPEVTAAPEPWKPQPIGPEDVKEAAEKLIKGFERAGYDEIAASIEARLAEGTLDPATAERLREILREWKARDAELANSDLTTRSDNQALVDGIQNDAARLAELLGWPGIAMIIRNPLTAARIGAAIASGGGTEVILTPIDVIYTVGKEMEKPGANLTEGDIWGQIGKETAWQVATDFAGDKAMGAIGSRVGGQLGDAAGAGLPPAVAVDDAARAGLAPAGAADDAARAGLPPAGAADDAARAGLPPAGAADDAARAGTASNAPEAGGPAGTGDGATGRRVAEPAPRAAEPQAAAPEAPKAASVEPAAPAPRPALEPSMSARNAPDGTQIPRERIREVGWTPEQLDDMQRIAKEHNAVIGSRTVNPDSLPKLEDGTSIPKHPEIKAKTAGDLDGYLGVDPKLNGESVLPAQLKEPPFERPPAGTNSLEARVWERFDQRTKELADLRGGVEKLESQGLVKWDRQTGLITNTGLNPDPATFGKSFAGDIDGVYARDATTGEFLTGKRADDLYAALRGSSVQSQHGWETNAVNDIVAQRGEDALSGAVDLHRKLEGGHMSGKEVTIEVGPNHVQVGPSNINDADHGLDPDWLRRGGLPVVVNEDLL